MTARRLALVRLGRAFLLAAAIACGAATAGHAELHLDITRGKIEPLPIAIPVFAGEAQESRDITQVLSADLERSGLFRPLDPRAFIDKEGATRTPPRYGDWRVINAQALVTGEVTPQPDGRLQVEFRLWDVYAEQQLTGLRYTTTEQN
jgi:TolB protein